MKHRTIVFTPTRKQHVYNENLKQLSNCGSVKFSTVYIIYCPKKKSPFSFNKQNSVPKEQLENNINERRFESKQSDTNKTFMTKCDKITRADLYHLL